MTSEVTPAKHPPAKGPPRAAPRRLRERVRALPRSLWICAAVAFVNAAAWTMITPTFQVPDEPVHIGYAQYMGEAGKVPRVLSPYFKPSRELDRAFQGVPFSILGSPTWSAADDRALDRDLGRDLGRVSEQGAGYASNNPPLYYATAALAYKAGTGASLLDRIFFMRLLSAVFAGLAVAFVFLFLRELLPGSRWAATVGALAAALNPLFGFVGGGVTPDVLLCTIAAAIFWLVARGFRRGLTPALGLALGLAVAAGVLTKGATFGLVPGVCLAIALLVRRAWGSDRRRALAGAGVAALAAGVPAAVWLAANTLLFDRAATSTTSGFQAGPELSVQGFVSYLWQFYLPRMPWMEDWTHPGFFPLWDTYFQGLVGRFGWFEWGLPEVVNWLALAGFALLVALAVFGLIRARGRLHARAGELLAYAAMAAGLMLLVAVVGYRYLVETGVRFEQARYLLPLIPLFAALIAVAVRSAGRRAGPALGALVVVAAVGHNLLAQLLSLNRYYL